MRDNPIERYVRMCGRGGATTAEVMDATGVGRSTASAGLARAAKEGRMLRSTMRRNGQSVYVHAEPEPPAHSGELVPVETIARIVDADVIALPTVQAHTALGVSPGYVVIGRKPGHPWALASLRVFESIAPAVGLIDNFRSCFPNNTYAVAKLKMAMIDSPSITGYQIIEGGTTTE